MGRINLAGMDNEELEEFLLGTKKEVDALNRAELLDILTYVLVAFPVYAVSEYMGKVFNPGGNFSLLRRACYLGAVLKGNFGYWCSSRDMARELAGEARECMRIIERRKMFLDGKRRLLEEENSEKYDD